MAAGRKKGPAPVGPVGRAYTPDWAARLRRRVKTFDDIAFTFVTALVLSLLRHERARYSRENQAMEQG